MTKETSTNMTRRGFVTALAGVFGTALMAGCGAPKGQEPAVEESTADQELDYKLDYGTSELYTKEDIDAAIDVVLAEFDTWTGCTMKRIAFTDDKTCTDNLAYVNSLREEDAPEFAQAMVILTDFHSPSEEEAEGTAWNPDSDYNDYSWILGRTDKSGMWKLMTWGY